MHKIRIVCLFFALALSFSSCEKDDICVDGDTPLLIIRFYNIAAETQTKAPNLLRVVGTGQTSPVGTFTDRSSLDSIAIPLRPGQDNTSFTFTLHSEDDADGNETGIVNTLSFDYSTNEVYVSRACGFVANYEDLETNVSSNADVWIKKIEVVNPTIENIEAAHVKIFH